MNVNTAIGAKVKQKRTERKMTMKQLGEKTGLSVGFLSQFERGLSSIALDSLEKISRVLETPLSELFEEQVRPPYCDPVAHGINLHAESINERVYQSSLKVPGGEFHMSPRIYTVLPAAGEEQLPDTRSHKGEEFVYILEGAITLLMDGKEFTLYAGDSIQIQAGKEHTWINHSANIVKLLAVNLILY